MNSIVICASLFFSRRPRSFEMLNSFYWLRPSPGTRTTQFISTSEVLVRWTVLMTGNLYETRPKSITSSENLKVGATTCPLNVRDSISALPSIAKRKVSENSPRMSLLNVTLIRSLDLSLTPNTPSLLLKWNFEPKGVSYGTSFQWQSISPVFSMPTSNSFQQLTKMSPMSISLTES